MRASRKHFAEVWISYASVLTRQLFTDDYLVVREECYVGLSHAR
jgi:hypothetical protein